MQSKETLEEAFECFKKEYPILKNYNLHHLLQVVRFGAKWQQEQYETEQAFKLQEIELKWMEYFSEGYDKGIKDSERMYSEEEVLKLFKEWRGFPYSMKPKFEKWFEQFKKK